MSRATRSIGDWECVKRIGEGSFGDVFVGKHNKSGKLAAIKVIDTSKWEEKSKTRRTKLLKREIRFSRLLYHPNIIKMIDTMVQGPKVLLILEHIPGGDLEAYIDSQENRKVDEDICRLLFRQIVSGVDYLHKNSIIHRDIKPANIMLDETHTIPKLIDFGFTNAYDENKAMYSFLGSPHYAAPELLKGIKYDGPKVDIWSLGVTLYTMLTGMLPFQAANLENLLVHIIKAQCTVPEYVPTGASDLIKKMIVRDTEKRISMEGVRHHYWVMEGHAEPPVDLAIPRETPIHNIDREVFNALKDFDFNDEELNFRALKAASPSKIKNVYCLLVEARNRKEAEKLNEKETATRQIKKESIKKNTPPRKPLPRTRSTEFPHDKKVYTEFDRRSSMNPYKGHPDHHKERKTGFQGMVKAIFSPFHKKKNI